MPKSSLKLTSQVRKVLAVLRFQARLPVVQVAKQSGLSAHVVQRILKQLEQHEVLRPYVVVNVGALGFSDYGIFVSRDQLTPSLRNRLITFLSRSASVPWVVEYAAGEYQYAFSIVARQLDQVDNMLLDLGERTGQTVLRQSVVQRVKWLVFGERSIFECEGIKGGYGHGSSVSPVEIDQMDWKLLRLLSAPSLKTYRELAQGLGVAVSTLEYRLRSLERSGIIIGYAHLIDVSKLGYSCYHVLVTSRRRTLAQRQHVLKFLQEHHLVVATSINVGEWEYECEVIVQDTEEILRFENALCAGLPEGSLTLRWLQVLKVHKLQPIPQS